MKRGISSWFILVQTRKELRRQDAVKMVLPREIDRELKIVQSYMAQVFFYYILSWRTLDPDPK
jgi:hypothetical protein